MRAVTGAITSSQPCPIAKIPRVLLRFVEKAGSDVLSSDAATYLRTAIEAADELNLFRRDLRRRLQQREAGGETEGERRPRRAPADEGGRWEPKVEAEEYGRWEPKAEEEEEYGMTAPAAGAKRSGKSKGSREDEELMEEKRGISAGNGDLGSPASEKRRRKKEKHVKKEDETGELIVEQSRNAIDDAFQGMVSKEGIDSEKRAKKKKERIKQEEEARDAKEAEQKTVHAGVAENGLASEEKKRKKRKHAEEEEVKKEVDVDGDLGSDKKRRKKMGRDGDSGNQEEVREHMKKKQRK